jgi:photosystem II stability/assembly factor-like uncharacterized protein
MVIDDFETELRQALAHQAERVPDAVADRLIRGVSHPRAPRRRTALALIAALAVVLGSGLVAVHVTSIGSSKPTKADSSGAIQWKLVADIGQPAWQAVASTDLQAGTLSCPTASTCYAQGWASVFGSTQIEVTHDAGRSWDRWSMPGGFQTATSQGLECVGADSCVTLAQNRTGTFVFFVTENGGSSWATLPGPSGLAKDFSFSDISCVTASSCIAIGGFTRQPNVALVTNDGWKTWTVSSFSKGVQPFDAQCFAGGECIVTGAGPIRSNHLSGAILYSTDGGASWMSAQLPAGVDATVSSLSCLSSSSCIAVDAGLAGHGNSVLVTADGGRRWTSAGARGIPLAGLMGVTCATSSDCWAPGLTVFGAGSKQASLYGSSDGGSNWKAAELPAHVDVDSLFGFGISCPDAQTCFALGYRLKSSQNPAGHFPGPPEGHVVLLTNRS